MPSASISLLAGLSGPGVRGWTIVDLLVALAVVLTVLGALRRRAGLVASLGSGLTTLVVAWLALVAVAAWGPRPWADAARHSAVVGVVGSPDRALGDVGRWWDGVTNQPIEQPDHQPGGPR